MAVDNTLKIIDFGRSSMKGYHLLEYNQEPLSLSYDMLVLMVYILQFGFSDNYLVDGNDISVSYSQRKFIQDLFICTNGNLYTLIETEIGNLEPPYPAPHYMLYANVILNNTHQYHGFIKNKKKGELTPIGNCLTEIHGRLSPGTDAFEALLLMFRNGANQYPPANRFPPLPPSPSPSLASAGGGGGSAAPAAAAEAPDTRGSRSAGGGGGGGRTRVKKENLLRTFPNPPSKRGGRRSRKTHKTHKTHKTRKTHKTLKQRRR